MIESLIVEFDQAKYQEFLSSGSKSPRARQYRKISGTRSPVHSEIPSDTTGKKSTMANHITRNTRVNVSHETREVSVTDIQPVHARPLPQFQVTGVPINPYDVTGTLSDDRDDVRVNYKREKLEQLPVQQIQNASLKHTFLLNHVRRAKFAFGDVNVKPTRPAFLKLHFPNATFSSARSIPFFRHTRPASLQSDIELKKSAYLNRR